MLLGNGNVVCKKTVAKRQSKQYKEKFKNPKGYPFLFIFFVLSK